jgi:CHASE2 domain-containing sensor protein
LKECCITLLTGFALAFLVHWLFGEEFATRQQARVYAPIAGDNYGEGKRDDIRVLLIDDAALAAAGQVWPAQYSYSARLLNAVAQYNPKAIFVDIYYGARRDDPTLPALTRSVCALKQQGIALFMATARDGAGNYQLRPELDALAGKCFDKVAIQYTPDDIDRIAWNYPLEIHRAGHGEPPLKSAALALYESNGGHLKVEEHPLAVTWGSKPAEHGIGWVRATHGGESTYCRPSHGLKELLPPGLLDFFYHDVDKPLCVFHETVRAGELAETTPESDARLRREIEGKIVLIGVAHTDSNDLLLSPLHGRIPGIYLHAMALDNLMVYGDGYARHMHLGFGREQVPMMAFLLLSMLLVTLVPKVLWPAVVNKLGWKALAHPVNYWTELLHLNWRYEWQLGALAVFLVMCALRLIATLLVGCAMVWVGQRVFGLGFLSVIGMIFLTMIAEWFDINEKLIHHLLPAPELPSSVPLHETEETAHVVLTKTV